jgi:hypothetical protein
MITFINTFLIGLYERGRGDLGERERFLLNRLEIFLLEELELDDEDDDDRLLCLCFSRSE